MVDVRFAHDKLGELSTDMIPHFFRSLSDHARLTLHLVEAGGTNDHHKAEALFKAFGRALRQAIAPDPYADPTAVPSTKGTL